MLCLLQVQNENGKSVPGMYEWTSLTRAQILRILKNLPEKFGDLFPAPQAPKLASLFKAFLELYNDICGSSPNANEVHTRVCAFLRQHETHIITLMHRLSSG
jgi:hypothetical protein